MSPIHHVSIDLGHRYLCFDVQADDARVYRVYKIEFPSGRTPEKFGGLLKAGMRPNVSYQPKAKNQSHVNITTAWPASNIILHMMSDRYIIFRGENLRKGQAVDHLGSCGNPIAERNVPVIGAVKHLATKPLVCSGNRIVYSNPVLAFLGQLIGLSQVGQYIPNV